MGTREELVDLLKTKRVNLSFTKKDGTTRHMKCTLLDEVIPEIVGSSKEYEHHITVYDLEKEGWRSVNLDSVVVHNVW